MTKAREEWLKTLKSDPGTVSYYNEKEHLDYAEREKKRFYDDFFVKKKPIDTAFAVFGPEQDDNQASDAYIDEVIHEKDGGTFVKFYGCPFKVKGFFSRDVVWGMQLSKYLFSGFPRDLLRSSPLLALFLGITWLINRRGLLKAITHLMSNIDHKVTKKLTFMHGLSRPGLAVYFPQLWYNKTEREIERALLAASKNEGLWSEFFRFFAPWFKLFLFIDNTYKSRVQDALYEGKDVVDTLRVLKEREQSNEKSALKTWKQMYWPVKLALLTSPALKRINKRFFKEIDKEKVKMDIDDWYFCLEYRSYNFRGWDYRKRHEERVRLNKKYKVVFLK